MWLVLLQKRAAGTQPVQAKVQHFLHGSRVSTLLWWRLNTARRGCHSPSNGLHHLHVKGSWETAEIEGCNSCIYCPEDQEDVWWCNWCYAGGPLISAPASAEIWVSLYSVQYTSSSMRWVLRTVLLLPMKYSYVGGYSDDQTRRCGAM